jgi:tRNA dimethylallyltransferase
MIYVVGPTAVGKSEVGVELALRLGGEIVSADSMQVYRGMNLGTAKPTAPERRGVPHHMIDVLDVGEQCDVARFRQMALEAACGIAARGRLPIVVGGTGLYVRALAHGIFEGPGRNETLRARFEALSSGELWSRLEKVDPVAAVRMTDRNRRRMVRALEFFEMTGQPISKVQTQWAAAEAPPIFGLAREREDLRRRCDARVERMFARGFVDEVRALAACGLAASPTAAKAIGYADVMGFLEGKVSEKDLMGTIQRRTWQYARRQMTWFRRETGIVWIACAVGESPAVIADRIAAAYPGAR